MVSKPSMALRAFVACAVLLGVANAVAAQGRPDPFLEAHRAAVASNVPGRVVTLRTKDGRTRFQPREPIALELSITLAADADPQTSDHAPEITEVVFDRAADVATPLVALTPDPGGPSVGVSCCMAGPPPWTRTFVLNGDYRIDRSGPLRLFVRSHRSHHAAPAGHDSSNVLTIDVAPRDPAWEVARAREAGAVLDDPQSTTAQIDAALASLESLATVEAGRVLLRRTTATGSRPPLTTLFAIDDRAAALRLMEDELRRPQRPIDGAFIREIARLARAAKHPEGPPYPYDGLTDLARDYSGMRAGALAGVFGLTGALAKEWADAARLDVNAFDGAVAPAIHAFPAEAEAALRTLDGDQILWLLRRHRRRFAHESLLPLLRGLYRRVDAFKTAALQPMCDVSIDECRANILEELARDRPRVDIDVMARLPDTSLPALEAAWVRLLETSVREATLVSAAERLERFGTEATAARAAQAWVSRHADWVPEVDGPLFAFLTRVNPSLAVGTLAIAAQDPETLGGAGSEGALPAAMAAYEWNDTVERFALDSLASDQYAVVGQAAAALSAKGSAAGRRGIEDALRRLRRSWPGQDTRDAEGLELTLAEALVTAPGWHLTGRSRAVAAAACVTDDCRSRLRPDDSTIVERRIAFVYPIGDEPLGTSFRVGDVTLPSVPALIAKLRQYPAGTRFYFDPLTPTAGPVMPAVTPGARLTRYDEVRAAAARVGIVVVSEFTPAK